MGHVQLRRARMRGLAEGKVVQAGRVESTEQDAKDGAERHQDYGFAGQPVDGQGLVLHIDGHTVIVRVDRTAERPKLAAYEVCVWHKEGHKITLKEGKVIEVEGTRLVVNMTDAIELQSATLKHNGVNIGSTHVHGGVQPGGANTSAPS